MKFQNFFSSLIGILLLQGAYALADDRTTRQIAIDIDTTLTTCCANIAEDFIGTFTTIAAIEASQQGGCKTQIINQATVGTTGFTITTSGFYRVVENIVFNPAISSAAITINADNVTLDLQCFSIVQGNSTANVDGISVSANVSSVSIENGKLANFARDGIRIASGCSLIAYTNITIQNCLYGIFFLGTDVSTIADIEITGLDLISNSTGMSLNFVERAIVSTCNFFGNTHAGVELISSFSNTIEGCTIENTNAASGSAFAISLISGGNNRVNTCYIDGVSTADTFSGNSAVGILIGATENDDIIINNQISNCTTTSNAQPFGIEMLYAFTNVTTLTSNFDNFAFNSVWSPNGNYLFSNSFETSNGILLDLKNEQPITLGSIIGSIASQISWSPDGSFIVVGANVYSIATGLPILVTGVSLTPNAVAWSPNGAYIAFIDNNGCEVYKFTGSQLILAATIPITNTLSLSWSSGNGFIAVSDAFDVFVLQFLGNELLQVTSTAVNNPASIEWSSDGQLLLVVDTVDNIINVYRFVGTNLVLAASLTTPIHIFSAQWSPDNQWISAVLTDGSTEAIIQIYKFLGNQITPVFSSSLPMVPTVAFQSWSPLGNVIASTLSAFGPLPNAVQPFFAGFAVSNGLQFPSGAFIQNNEVANVRGPALPNGQFGVSSGRGISASSATNLIIQNTVFNGDINYVFVNNIFEQFTSSASAQPNSLSNTSFPPL